MMISSVYANHPEHCVCVCVGGREGEKNKNTDCLLGGFLFLPDVFSGMK